MARIPAFQAGRVGSIPITRSIVKNGFPDGIPIHTDAPKGGEQSMRQ